MAEPALAASARFSAARAAALLAVLLALAASVGERLSGRGSPPAEPAACRVLPAVHDLPVPGGTAVQLIVAPALAGRSAVTALLYELAWRREAIELETSRIVAHVRELPAALGASLSVSLVLLLSAWLLIGVGLISTRDVKLMVVPAVWFAAALAAYLTTPHDLAWHLRWSLDRVLAAPLPGFSAFALGSVWAPRLDARPAPGRWTGAAPSA